jgi:endonuclease/exonuclease/phosphatase family metal-dependent hydrolase
MPFDHVKPAQIALLVGPPQEERDRFVALEKTAENHAAALASVPSLQRVEAPVSNLTSPLSFPLTVAAWNLERCYAVEKSAAVIEAQGAELVLLSEVDNGMARTGQRHTSREIAALLGMAYAYGVEFLELELGKGIELDFCEDDFNLHGFHGNALMAKTALQAPVMIRVPDQLFWFNEEVSVRVGSRCAIASAVMTTEGPLYAVSVHLESRGDAAHRRNQMEALLDAVDQLAGDAPVIIGGDLNTGLADGGDFEKETLFEHAYSRGFERHGGPIDQMTTRPSRVSVNPRGVFKLDWFLTRGLDVEESRIVPALSPDGEVLSDHEMVVAKIGGFKR